MFSVKLYIRTLEEKRVYICFCSWKSAHLAQRFAGVVCSIYPTHKHTYTTHTHSKRHICVCTHTRFLGSNWIIRFNSQHKFALAMHYTQPECFLWRLAMKSKETGCAHFFCETLRPLKSTSTFGCLYICVCVWMSLGCSSCASAILLI